MKKQLVVLATLFMMCSVVCAQTIKYGSIESTKVIELMPETDSVTVNIEKYSMELSNEMQLMQSEYQQKYAAYTKNVSQYSTIMRQQKEKELTDLGQSIEQFKQIASTDLQQKHQEYMAPVLEKVNLAIKKVSESMGISFVIDKAQPPFVYMNDKMITNITDKVILELGL